MKKSILFLLVCCTLILLILSGCSLNGSETQTVTESKAQTVSEDKTQTVSAYVCIREYDGDHGLDSTVIDTFMSQQCENTEITYVPMYLVPNPQEVSYIRMCVFYSEDRTTLGMCYEYPDEETAKKDFNSNSSLVSVSKSMMASVNSISSFDVRVGKFVFWAGEGLWASLLSHVGIEIQPNTYRVPVKEEIPYQKLEPSLTVEELFDILKEKGYSIYSLYAGEYSAISQDGSETFSISSDEDEIIRIEENKNDLYHNLFYFNSDGDPSLLGLTVYRCEDGIIIGRGDVLLSVIGE